jgi:hypothetical protein
VRRRPSRRGVDVRVDDLPALHCEVRLGCLRHWRVARDRDAVRPLGVPEGQPADARLGDLGRRTYSEERHVPISVVDDYVLDRSLVLARELDRLVESHVVDNVGSGQHVVGVDQQPTSAMHLAVGGCPSKVRDVRCHDVDDQLGTNDGREPQEPCPLGKGDDVVQEVAATEQRRPRVPGVTEYSLVGHAREEGVQVVSPTPRDLHPQGAQVRHEVHDRERRWRPLGLLDALFDLDSRPEVEVEAEKLKRLSGNPQRPGERPDRCLTRAYGGCEGDRARLLRHAQCWQDLATDQTW